MTVPFGATRQERWLYPFALSTLHSISEPVGTLTKPLPKLRELAFFCSAAFLLCVPVRAQVQKPAEKPESKPAPTEKNAAQIELLETKYRFESNGDSRKEVHALVRINNELGVQQFRALKFDFNRRFQSVEIPLVRVTHASGGTADVLPSAVADNPNPAVVDFPAYHDVRVKSVRILGLAPGDSLEYRVITMTTKPPLAPDFWLDHSFDRTGVVTEERFDLDLPAGGKVRTRFQAYQPSDQNLPSSDKENGRTVYKWVRKSADSANVETGTEARPDIQISTFSSWDELADRLAGALLPSEEQSAELHEKVSALTSPDTSPTKKAESVYNCASQKIKTVDVPLGATGFRTRKPIDIFESGYATPEDKFLLFAALARNLSVLARAGFVSTAEHASEKMLPTLDLFDHLLTMSGSASESVWVDLNLEVAPFGMIPTQLRDKPAFLVGPAVQDRWQKVLESLPFAPTQKVEVNAAIDDHGMLSAHVSYAMRGDNELALRVAFHRTPKEKWKEVAQLLALSDGFRGQVTSATASDPYETKEPFHVEYEVVQQKFVNWEKKPVRIPAILPLVGLPDPPPAGAATIDLGTPLEVTLNATIKLPSGTTAKVPPATSVARDYAEFSSSYSAKASTITAARKIHFLLRQIPSSRAVDYNAFLRAVQNDQAQDFTLENGPPGASPKPSRATAASTDRP